MRAGDRPTLGRMIAAAAVIGILAAGLGAQAEPQQPTPAPQPAKPQEPTNPAPQPPPAEPSTPEAQPPSTPPPGPTQPTGAPQEPQPAPTEEPAAPPGEPREAIVTLKDGQRYTGFLVDRNAERIILKIAGIDTSIPVPRIERVAVLPPVLERYKSMRAATDDNDGETLLRLAEWLRARGQWDTALSELDHILRIQPENGEAKRLQQLVQSQKALAEKAGTARAAPRPGGSRPASPSRSADGFPLLSDADINIIKVYETDLSDPPRLMIARETIKRLIEEHAGDPLIPSTVEGRDAIYRYTPARLLDLMFRLQARNLYGDVKVLDEPRSMRLFRDNVYRVWLINSCATMRCHGGSEAGRLMLDNQRAGTDPVLYTNFLILDRFGMHDGKPVINYDDSAASPILQMALPRDISTRPHPTVPGADGRGDLWRPFFKTPDDRRFQEAVDWIKSMYRPRPDYPVHYTPPIPQGAPSPGPGSPPVVR